MSFLDSAAVPDEEMGQEPAPEEEGTEPATASDGQPDHIQRLLRWSDPLKTINICDELIANGEEDKIAGLGMLVSRQYKIDDDSRSDWLDRTQAAMDLAMQVAKGKDWPWPGASNVVYPLVTAAAIQFSARAYPAIIPGPSIVKGIVIGDDKGMPVLDPESGEPVPAPDGQPAWLVKPGIKQQRAERIGQHMSWQLLEEQPEWETETDKLLLILAIVGCRFRKSFFDTENDRNAAVTVGAKELVINYRAKSLEVAPRTTEIVTLYPYQVEEAIRAGLFLEHSITAGQTGMDEDAEIEYLEQHRRYDLDGDGYAEPYICTVHKATDKVVRIVSRYEPEGIKLTGIGKKVRKIVPVQYYTQYDFLPNPDGGIYGLGLGQLINPINQAVDTTLNQIFDAATLQTAGGGFIGKGLNMHSGSVRFKLGEYKAVNALGSTVRENVVPLTFPGPSPVLFQLLGLLIDAGKEIGSNTEVLSGNQSNSNVPATTTLALIEQGLKVYTAVWKRIRRALKSELDKQFRLNRLYLDQVSEYRFRDEWRVIKQKDYIDGAGVEPVADESMVTDLQQLARAEALKMFAGDADIDQMELKRIILTALKIDVEQIDKLLIKEKPNDPAMTAASIEFAIREVEARAKAVNQLAQAMEHMAKADALVSEDFRSWMMLEMEALKGQLEGIGNGGTGEGAGGPGASQAGLPRLAAPSGNGAVPGLPA